MSSPILLPANTTTAALPFEAAAKKSSLGGDNFGAALDRASSMRSFSHQNVDEIVHRKPATSRTAKNTGMKRLSNPRQGDRPQGGTARKASSTFRTGAHDSHAPESSFSKKSRDAIDPPAVKHEDGSLAGALAVPGVAKPVDLAGGTKRVESHEEHGGNDDATSPATVADGNQDTEAAPGLSLTVDLSAATGESEKQSGQALLADFEYLKSPEGAPDLSTAPSEPGVPVSDSKMILSPNPVKSEFAVGSGKDATMGASQEMDAAQHPPAIPPDAEIAPPADASLLTLPPDDVRATRAARRATGLAADGGINQRSNGSQLDGISSAKVAATMKNTPNKDEFAGSGRQELPGGNISAARALHSSSLSGTAKDSVTELMFAAATGDTSKIFDARSEGNGVGDITRFAPARMDRIGEIISREVRMFKRAADDQVDVVLTPDAKTQISLRLQWRDGQVEVQARCELGDHHALSLQWGQLQTSLSQQGVKLAALTERTSTGFTEFFNPSSFSQSHNGQPRHNDAEPGGGPRQPAPTSPVSGLSSVTARRAGLSVKAAPTNDRFETWA